MHDILSKLPDQSKIAQITEALGGRDGRRRSCAQYSAVLRELSSDGALTVVGKKMEWDGGNANFHTGLENMFYEDSTNVCQYGDAGNTI